MASTRPPRLRSDKYDLVPDGATEPAAWQEVTMTPPLVDVKYTVAAEGIARISIDRPHLHNAFRPRTVFEMSRCLEHAQDDVSVGVIILTGEGPHAFCSGGDQRVRGNGGYDDGSEDVPRLRVLDLQVQMIGQALTTHFNNLSTSNSLLQYSTTIEYEQAIECQNTSNDQYHLVLKYAETYRLDVAN